METNKKIEINYLFFGFLLFFLIALTFSHFSRMSPPFWGAPLFFLLYALLQAVLEVLCLMFLGLALHRWMPRWTFKIYIGLSFGFLLAHFANYTVVRLMDATLSYVFKFFFGRGLDHFRVAFLALNFNSMMVGIIIGTIFLVPAAGIAFYWLTHKISIKKPLALSQAQIFSIIAVIGLTLLSLDILAKPYLTKGVHEKYSKTLPLGSTFLSPSPDLLAMPSPVSPVISESQVEKILERPFSLRRHPDIYLFVIETLRRDFIDPAIAPAMSQFAADNFAPALSFSNANATQLSWFAIFHSLYPYKWTQVRDSWAHGSAPLRILKKMGYSIHVYSSADLLFFNMDEVIFGKNRELADSVKEYHSQKDAPCERDRLAIESLAQDAGETGKNIFIVFLDSTHSEYSAPADFERPFQPAATSVDYLAISKSSKDLELLKNRYRNSIHWVDHLIGGFLQKLREAGRYEDAIILLTGDHGEEFFEDGALFHGTHLNDWQTKVPIFYRFPGGQANPAGRLSTHVDIFPTILHYLTGEEMSFSDGVSLFRENRRRNVLCIQNNGSDVPYEFSLSDGRTRLLARFLNPPNINSIPGVQILSLETQDGPANKTAMEKQLSQNLGEIFCVPEKILPKEPAEEIRR